MIKQICVEYNKYSLEYECKKSFNKTLRYLSYHQEDNKFSSQPKLFHWENRKQTFSIRYQIFIKKRKECANLHIYNTKSHEYYLPLNITNCHEK